MSKLKLVNIKKSYFINTTEIQALRGVSLQFRNNEFVSILGPSGCGKTTMLNIIGGLDRYDSGDLFINELSTKLYKARDWDAYRNRSIGFVFQSYNLIGHQNVLSNVEIAMTLSGVSVSERKQRAIQALKDVGLEEQIYKKPNQLSGGQMQRVAIARALVNNPDIILADEPTGALDSATSVQVMEILKNIAKEKLVIMVTHNSELAKEYSTRIIKLKDGEIISDSNPVKIDEKDDKPIINENQNTGFKDGKPIKTSMSFFTALKLSFKNLLTKKWRTIITSFAGSIGIIGVALVLAFSNGLNREITKMQTDTLVGYPISISSGLQLNLQTGRNNQDDTFWKNYINDQVIYRYNSTLESQTKRHNNILSDEYLAYIDAIYNKLPSSINNISYRYSLKMNVIAKGNENGNPVIFDTNGGGMTFGGISFGGSSYWQELPENDDFILSMYDVLATTKNSGNGLPNSKNEVAIVIDANNKIDDDFFANLNLLIGTTIPDYQFATQYDFNELLGKTILKAITNDNFYQFGTAEIAIDKDNILTLPAYNSPNNYDISLLNNIYNNQNDDDVPLTITSILRIKEDVSTEYLSTGIAYTPKLTKYLLEDAIGSETKSPSQIVQFQKAILESQFPYAVTNFRYSGQTIPAGTPLIAFEDENFSALKDLVLESLFTQIGMSDRPTGIDIYSFDLAGKERIKDYLDAYNKQITKANKLLISQGIDIKDDEGTIYYIDLAEIITEIMGNVLKYITIGLSAFASISLFVSTIMIGIITYVSVLERTKEIGILRSVGARKKDISRVFNAETMIIGFTAGTMGILISFITTLVVNPLISRMTDGEIVNIASMAVWHVVSLIAGSMLLTLIAGLIPSRAAAKKDPVIALRTE